MKQSEDKACKISITTTVDGDETQATRKGSLRLSFAENVISYTEENAFITITIRADEVEIVRNGDYSMFLPLKRDTKTRGEIGINGAIGAVDIKTSRLLYSTTDTSLMLSVHYDLLFGEEKQAMQIRLLARYI